jgi:K+-transporting ATPase KdpC subunit
MEKGIIIKQLRPTIVLLFLFTIIFGLIYPGIVTLILQLSFPFQANGSLIQQGDNIRGSELLGQEFTDPKYFWSRPSAIDTPYDAAHSTGSNLSPANPTLLNNVKKRVDALQKVDPTNTQPIPVDLVTSSASGLDPHISLAAAVYQIHRVAWARNTDEKIIFDLVKSSVEFRQFKLLGEPRINVVKLNLKLDQMSQP